MHPFKYFLGPPEDMAGIATNEAPCAFCGATAEAFSLRGALLRESGGDASGFGCASCLAAGRFAFPHNTELGPLGENGGATGKEEAALGHLREGALEELRRTPALLTWEGERWLTHCDDFMAYLGTWAPGDFAAAAPADPRGLFLRMTRDETLRFLWDDSLDGGETLPVWNVTYYAFRCLHCEELAGSWDCDQD
jgi:uncharacterized protein CbrC (UPF0167 family)